MITIFNGYKLSFSLSQSSETIIVRVHGARCTNESNYATRMPQVDATNQLCLFTHYATQDILTRLSFLDLYFSFPRHYRCLKVSSLSISSRCRWHFNFEIHLISGCLARSLESRLLCRILIPACRCLMQHLSSATLVIITPPTVYRILLLSFNFSERSSCWNHRNK